jgi:hypothetical protein
MNEPRALRTLKSEKAFMQQVRDLAKLKGWLLYHTHDSRRSEPGFPDLVLLKPPVLMFVELKRDDEQPSEDQERWLGELAGVERVTVQVWRPQDWDDVVATLALRANGLRDGPQPGAL